MNQCDATTAVILFFRERPEGEAAIANDKQLARAVKVLEKRREVLSVRMERRRTAVMCKCGQRKASNIVCWSCWVEVPEQVREDFEHGTVEKQREALRVIFHVARRRGEQAAEV